MKVVIIVAFLQLALGASISDVTCPDSCTCQVTDEYLETSCHSYEFIKKLIPKQQTKIVRLNINNASLVNVDLKLKYLKNLHTLDLSGNDIVNLPLHFPYLPKLKNLNLSHNHLTNINLAQLPVHLEEIDLSHNRIINFPQDWSSLNHLKTLHLHDNPIDCECYNLETYEQLLKGGIIASSNLTCRYPKEFEGRPLDSVNCKLIKENLLNAMLGDDFGSGSQESSETTESEDKAPLVDQEEFITADRVTENADDVMEEGSGDEGSGAGDLLIPVSACHFNCSTANPIGKTDEENASAPPGIIDAAKAVFEDIIEPEKVHEEEKVEATTETTPKEVDEAPMIKETDKNDVETIPTNDTITDKMQRASLDNPNNRSVYIVVGLVIAFIAFLLIYFLNKRRNQNRRNQRKRNKSNENGYGEEMKPLGKSAEAAKPVEPLNSKLPEATPLLNGQNGKVAEDRTEEPKIKSQPEDLEEVELRKPEKDSLTPQPERVTIKAGELPDSIPKTPLRVHRQVNSDGEIVTTTISD